MDQGRQCVAGEVRVLADDLRAADLVVELAVLDEGIGIRLLPGAGLRRGVRARPHDGPRLRSEARPFTGLIFCETCGSVCYRRTSKNRKGVYNYYNCGCRQRNGPDVCSNAASVREDTLIQLITSTLDEAFEDTDAVVEEAIEEARKMLNENRDEAQRVRTQLVDLDRKVARLTGLRSCVSSSTGG